MSFFIKAYPSYVKTPYYSSWHINDSSYVFLGEVIGVDTLVNYTQSDKVIGYICSFQVRVVDNFDLEIPDTVCIQPFANKNDTISIPILNYMSAGQNSTFNDLYYFRGWRENNTYYYSLIDYYMGLPLVNDSIHADFTRIGKIWSSFSSLFRKGDRSQTWSKKKFEKVLKRKMRKSMIR